jgi:hypothetical protein
MRRPRVFSASRWVPRAMKVTSVPAAASRPRVAADAAAADNRDAH